MVSGNLTPELRVEAERAEAMARAAALMVSGKVSNGWWAESMSLYEEIIPRLALFISFRESFSWALQAAKPWARLPQESSARCTPRLCWSAMRRS